jgi:hypothetical protein
MQECEDDCVQTDISTLKMALMREDLPESRCDEACISAGPVALRVCPIDDTHLSHNENSESMDNAT